MTDSYWPLNLQRLAQLYLEKWVVKLGSMLGGVVASQEERCWVDSQPGTFMHGVSMFSWCMCGFLPATLTSSHILYINVMLIFTYMRKLMVACLYLSLWWTCNLSSFYPAPRTLTAGYGHQWPSWPRKDNGWIDGIVKLPSSSGWGAVSWGWVDLRSWKLLMELSS